MEFIKQNDRVLAIIHRASDWTPGLNFCTPDEMFIQAGCWFYPAGKKLASHFHKENERTVTRTQKLTYVVNGSMKVTIYSDQRKVMKEFVLSAGDFAVFAYGGHGYEILEDDTKVLEVKNGPFTDVEKDKELI